MIEKCSLGLNGPADGILPSSGLIEPAVVLLAGSMGGLGSFLLADLLQSSGVQCVFAFNRPSTKSIEERQKAAFKDRGLQVELLDSNKLAYIETNASLEKCCLPSAQYEETISSFEDSIRASRNLVNLGLASPWNQNLRFLFTSSIGSTQGWDNSKGPLPEEVQLDPSVQARDYREERLACNLALYRPNRRGTSIALVVLPESTGVSGQTIWSRGLNSRLRTRLYGLTYGVPGDCTTTAHLGTLSVVPVLVVTLSTIKLEGWFNADDVGISAAEALITDRQSEFDKYKTNQGGSRIQLPREIG
ncbi:hypothetical protein JVU11DRAFT_9252 [Chiua virens]|nr:hypothetical protein JVU11DRAFT_9252 [Chiua virens]